MPEISIIEGTLIAAVIGAFSTWLAHKAVGQAAFQTAINDGFAKLTKELQAERDDLVTRLTATDKAFEEFRAQAAKAQLSLEKEIHELRLTITKLSTQVGKIS